MLTRTIEALKDSECVDRIIVTTESQQYAELALNSGAEVPFIRDSSLASDDSNTIDVIADVIQRIGFSSKDRVACVYATNPLLDFRIVDLGNRMLDISRQFSYVTPLVMYGFPPQRSITLADIDKAAMTNPEFMYEHSQNLMPLFHESAQFWWATSETWMAKIGMQKDIVPIILKEWMQQDIDTMDDWIAAEAKFDYKDKYRTLWEKEIADLVTKYLP